MSQVITIRKDGSIFGLDHKSRGLDLRKFGNASTERITLIEWDEVNQAWFVRWEGRHKNKEWVEATFDAAEVDYTNFLGFSPKDTNRVLFKDYDFAVKAEVAVIQVLQKKGIMVSNG